MNSIDCNRYKSTDLRKDVGCPWYTGIDETEVIGAEKGGNS
jgi:hypothetical protein